MHLDRTGMGPENIKYDDVRIEEKSALEATKRTFSGEGKLET